MVATESAVCFRAGRIPDGIALFASNRLRRMVRTGIVGLSTEPCLKHRSHALDGSHQGVDFLAGIVKREAGSRGAEKA